MIDAELTALDRLEGKVDLLLERQIKITTVLFDTEGNDGLATRVQKICEMATVHDGAIKALAMLSKDNRKWLVSITSGLVAVVTTVAYFFMKHIGLTE